MQAVHTFKRLRRRDRRAGWIQLPTHSRSPALALECGKEVFERGDDWPEDPVYLDAAARIEVTLIFQSEEEGLYTDEIVGKFRHDGEPEYHYRITLTAAGSSYYGAGDDESSDDDE